jgi:hypothetical protein
VGDYLVTATRARIAAPSNRFPRYHVVVVEVTVKNASDRLPQRFLSTPRLEVKPDYKHWPSLGLQRPWKTAVDDLLPGEESKGSYAFVVRDGTTPVALSFVDGEASVELGGLPETESGEMTSGSRHGQDSRRK